MWYKQHITNSISHANTSLSRTHTHTHKHNTNENSVAGRTIEHYKEEENHHVSEEKKEEILLFFFANSLFADVKIRRQIEDAKRYVPCQHDERDDVHKKER